jgi:hypothetical protein
MCRVGKEDKEMGDRRPATGYRKRQMPLVAHMLARRTAGQSPTSPSARQAPRSKLTEIDLEFVTLLLTVAGSRKPVAGGSL